MTNAERFAAYLDKLEAEGKLSPGDRLPKYVDVAQMFGIPYSSVQRIFKTLEYSGRVKIVNGVGSFLNGGDDLDVDVYVTDTTFDVAWFQGLLEDISRKNDLHLNIQVKAKTGDLSCDVQEHKVVIAESDPWLRMDGCLMDYSFFDDYETVMSQFWNHSRQGNMNIQLPFYGFAYQGAVNVSLLERMGVEIDELSNLSQWPELSAQCAQAGVYPAAISSSNHSLWNFPLYDLSFLLASQERDDLKGLFRAPLYASDLGGRILRIAESCLPSTYTESSFCSGKTVLEFMVGSWLTLQAESKFGMKGDDFRIVPLCCRGRHMLPYTEVYLKTFANPSITKNERGRIWRFLKILLSRKYQKTITSRVGIVSPRRDMKASDHGWVTREDFLHFFPTSESILVYRDSLSLEKLAVLSSLYELYESSASLRERIVHSMDSALCKEVIW